MSWLGTVLATLARWLELLARPFTWPGDWLAAQRETVLWAFAVLLVGVATGWMVATLMYAAP